MQKAARKHAIIAAFLFFTFLSGPVSYCQNTTLEPLIDIIKLLEDTYGVSFSYAPNDIQNVLVATPSDALSLTEALAYLNSTTPFQFTAIDTRYITVVKTPTTSLYCGKIIDASTGLPMVGATVVADTNDFATTTNTEGEFFIPEAARTKAFTVTFIGFTPLTIPVGTLTKECTSLLMLPTIATLDEVLITSYFTKGIDKLNDGSIVLNSSDFGLIPGQVDNDILQIVQALPGVESVDETISNINIRGGTHAENLILWDDIKMYQSGHFFGLISAFNPDLTQSVSIYKNGTLPRYGESVSSVIHMKSDDTITRDLTAGAGFNFINGSAFVRMPISKKVGLQISGRRSLNDLLETPVYDTYSSRIFQDTEIFNSSNDATMITADEDFRFYDFSTKLLWDASEKDRVRFNFLTIDNQLDFTETIANSQQSETSSLSQRSLVGGVNWERSWNDSFKSYLMTYGTYYALDALNRDIFTTQELRQENEVIETGVKVEGLYAISKRLQLRSGYHFTETGIANTQDVNLPRFRNFEKDVLRTHSVFGRTTYTSEEKNTIINAGLRLNYFTKLDQILVEPRLSVHQKIRNGLAIELMGEFKSQTTTQRIDFESDFLGVEKRRWVLATGDEIPVLQSKQGSFGVIYQRKKWFIETTAYYKFVNGISSRNQGFQNQFQFVEAIGSYTNYGLELAVNKKWGDFSSWISYTYAQNDYEFPSLVPSEFPNNLDIRHAASLAGSYTLDRFKIALGINWHTGKPFTLPLSDGQNASNEPADPILYDTPNSKRLPDYFRTDLSAEYRWNVSEKIDAKINVAILNILDTDNTLNIRYARLETENGSTRINQIEQQSLGLTPNVSVQVLF